MKPPRWLIREISSATQEQTPRLAWRTQLPGQRRFVEQVWQLWLALAALGLFCGLLWRTQGGGPDLYRALDVFNAALWLAALWLWPQWQTWQQRLHHGAGRQPLYWQVRSLCAAHVLGLAILLGLAPSAALLGYAARAPVAQVVLSDAAGAFHLPLWAALALALAVLAPTVLLLALSALHLCHAVGGTRVGLALWLLLALAGNSRLLCGFDLSSSIPQVSSALRHIISYLQSSPEQTYYLDDVWRDGLSIPLGWLVLSAVLLGLVQACPPRAATRYSSVWLAALAGSLAIAGRALAQLWQASAASPVNAGSGLQELLLTGLACAWLVLLISELRQVAGTLPSSSWADLAFALLALAGSIVLTLPSLMADQASRTEVLALAAVCGSLWLAVVAVVRRWVQWTGSRPYLLLPGLLVLLLPWIPAAADVPPPAVTYCLELSRALLDPLAAPAAGWVVCSVAALGGIGLLWPVLVRRRRQRSLAAQP